VKKRARRQSAKKKIETIDPFISVNLSLPKIVKGDGCSVEVLTRSPSGERLATWDGRQWVGWAGDVIHGVTHWTTEGVAHY